MDLEIARSGVRKYQNLDGLNSLSNKLGYAFSSRYFGNMSYVYGSREEVIKNQFRFAQASDFSVDDVAAMFPVHGVHPEIVTVLDKGRGVFDKESAIPNTDVLITESKKVVLGLRPADCMPVIVTNQESSFIGLSHAGRAGVEQKIGEPMVEAISKFGIEPADLIVGIGPAVLACCYELDYLKTDQLDKWLKHIKTSDNSVLEIDQVKLKPIRSLVRASSGEKVRLDYVGVFIDQLISLGVQPGNIEQSHLCTACLAEKGEFFSHQVSEKYKGTESESEFPEGRFLSVAWLK